MRNDKVISEELMFVGRRDEQDRFREALRFIYNESRLTRKFSRWINDQDTNNQASIFLVHGEGGIGKSRLLRRFNEILEYESPFNTHFQKILVDWEIERFRYIDLQAPHDNIRVEVVFDHLFRIASDAGWARHFREYKEVLQLRNQAETKVAKALQEEKDETRYAGIRDLGSEVIAAIIRRGIGISNTWQKPIAKGTSEVVQAGAEKLAVINEWLSARVDFRAKEEEVYRAPNESIARALGDGLGSVASRQPLVIFLDTYEIVERCDPWLRAVIKSAGGGVIWVIASRNDLATSRYSDQFVGYSAEFPRGITVLELQELAIDNIIEYVEKRVPKLKITRKDAEMLHRLTLGVPLALRYAGDLLAKNISITSFDELFEDQISRNGIINHWC